MIRRHVATTIAILAVFVVSVSARPANGQTLSDLAPLLEPIRAEHGLPSVAAAVTRGPDIVAAGAVGTRVQGMDIPVTLQDRFHLGSDAKAMAATLAGSLVEAGLLAWDTRIGSVLGNVVADMDAGLQDVTLRQLLSHSSGIPTDNDEIIDLYFTVEAFDYTLSDLRLRALESWKQKTPVVPHGSPFQYSNLGYVFVGIMVEQVTGQHWESLMHARIFRPLGLETAGLGAQATLGRYDAPVGHQPTAEGGFEPMPWGAAADMPPMMGPAGNAHMSILDFARWAAWNAGGGYWGPSIVRPETLAEIHRPQVETPERPNPPPGTPERGAYALGWGWVAFDWTGGRRVLAHNGSNGLNLAKILVDRERDLGIVFTTNAGGEKAERAGAAVLEALYRRFAEPEQDRE